MLKPGDIVTDLARDSVFKGKQGLVINVQLYFWEPPEITVCFDRDFYPYFLETGDETKTVTCICEEEDLRLDADWEPEAYAERFFKGCYHSVSTHKRKLDLNTLCMVDGCPHTQTTERWINIWGSVFNVYLCPDHAGHYKKYSCMDSFPFRQVS